jgi:WD40 repeat protein
MSSFIACPKCKSTVEIRSENLDADGRTSCPACGAGMKFHRKLSTAPSASIQSIAPPSTDKSEDAWPDPFADPLAAPLDEGAFDGSTLPSVDQQDFNGTSDWLTAELPPLAPAILVVRSLPPTQAVTSKPSAKPSASASTSVRQPSVGNQSPSSVGSGSGVPALKWLLMGGVSVGLLLILGVGAMFFLFRGNRPAASDAMAQSNAPDQPTETTVPTNDPPVDPSSTNVQPEGNANNKSNFGPLKLTSSPVVFTEPIPGVEVEPIPAYALAKKEEQQKFIPQIPATSIPDSKESPPETSDSNLAETPVDAKAQWEIAADPIPESDDYMIAENLNVPLQASPYDNGNMDLLMQMGKKPIDVYPPTYGIMDTIELPILASQRGPYMIAAPSLTRMHIGWKATAQGGELKKLDVVGRDIDNIPVLDLRTGDQAGTFSSRIPFWLSPVLSPDGMTLVGPHHELEPPKEIVNKLKRSEKEEKQWKELRQSLFVWTRDSKERPRPLRTKGLVRSLTFANNRALVLLTENPGLQIEVWDIASGKQARTIPLDSELVFAKRYDDADPLNLAICTPQVTSVLAISPGGKYAAIPTKSGIKLVSLQEGKLIGTLPTPGPTTVTNFSSGQRQWTEQKVAPGQGGFDGQAINCFGLEFLPSGDRLAFTFLSTVDNTKYARHLQYDLLSGALMHQMSWHDYVNSMPPTVKDDIKAVVPIAVLSGDERILNISTRYPSVNEGMTEESRFVDLEKQGASRSKFILRYPRRGPLLVVEPPKTKGDTGSIMAVSQDQFLEQFGASIAVNEAGLKKRPKAQFADRSSMRSSVAKVPAVYQSIPICSMPSAKVSMILPSVEAPAAWGDSHALAFNSENLGRQNVPVEIRLADLSNPKKAQLSQPFQILDYAFHGGGSVYDRAMMGRDNYIPAAMPASGDWFAFGDPDRKGHVEVWSTAPQRKLVFKTGQSPSNYVFWLGVAADNSLISMEAGRISCWDMREDQVVGRYSVAGDYQLPLFLSPDRKLLFASRGESFDVLNTLDGTCLTRLTLDGTQAVLDAAFCPDGRCLAVQYAPNAKAVQSCFHGYNQGPGNTVAVWDLSDGSVRVNKNTNEPILIREMGWIDSDLLVFGTTVYDFKIDAASITLYRTVTRGLDGRLWTKRGQPENNNFSWRQPSITTQPTKQEAGFLDPNRRIFDSTQEPIQVVLDIGNAEKAKKYAPGILTGLQRQGFKIGKSKNVLRIDTHISGSNNEIQFLDGNRVRTPIVLYSWELSDSNGNELAVSQSGGVFNIKDTKYKTQVDLETRRVTGDDAYNFGRQDPATAMATEIMDSGVGLQTAAPLRDDRLRTSSGNYELPVKLDLVSSE